MGGLYHFVFFFLVGVGWARYSFLPSFLLEPSDRLSNSQQNNNKKLFLIFGEGKFEWRYGYAGVSKFETVLRKKGWNFE